MKKRFIIILSIQSILILIMLAYSIVQRAEADKQSARAEDERRKAEILRSELVKLKAQQEKDIQ